MNRLKKLLDRIFRREDINGDGRCPAYLYRWTLLALPQFKVYLHKFVAEDWSKDMHDHPKRFVTIGLWGQYIECTPNGSRVFLAPWIRTFSATHVHRIELINDEPCWTLAIVFKSVRSWGFWVNNAWVNWRDYVGSKRADEMKSCDD
jgi:hypothetical protein